METLYSLPGCRVERVARQRPLDGVRTCSRTRCSRRSTSSGPLMLTSAPVRRAEPSAWLRTRQCDAVPSLESRWRKSTAPCGWHRARCASTPPRKPFRSARCARPARASSPHFWRTSSSGMRRAAKTPARSGGRFAHEGFVARHGRSTAGYRRAVKRRRAGRGTPLRRARGGDLRRGVAAGRGCSPGGADHALE